MRFFKPFILCVLASAPLARAQSHVSVEMLEARQGVYDRLRDAEILIERQPDRTVQSTRLTLLGGGVQNKKTHALIALACSGSDDPETGAPGCDVVRLVLAQPGSSQASFFGPAFRITGDNLKGQRKQLKRVLRAIAANYRKAYKLDHKDPNNAVLILAAMGAVPLAIKLTVSLNAGWPIYVGIGVFVLVWRLGIADEALLPSMIPARAGKIVANFNDQDGWNWADRAKQVSDEKFELFYQINSVDPLNQIQ